MPRLLNWVRGEGTVKNQRWGLGGLGLVPDYIPGSINTNDPNFGVWKSNDPTPYVADINYGELAAISNRWDSVLATQIANGTAILDADGNYIGPTVGKTLGQWINDNSTILLVGGVLGLFLFAKR